MLLTWIRFFIIIKKVTGTILCAGLGSLNELFTNLSTSRSFHNSIISLLESHCLSANTTRPNKNVYCFSSTATTFLLFPSSTIITFLLFSSAATRFLLFSFYHRNSSIVFLHHRYHHNSTVFPPPPPQFCCFPRPHHLHIYCFPAPSTTPFPPQFCYFSSTTTTITTTFPSFFLLFYHHHNQGRINCLKDLALEQYFPRKLQHSAFKLHSRKAEIFALLFVPPDPKSIGAIALEENWNLTVFERLKCVASFTSASQKPSHFWLDDVK